MAFRDLRQFIEALERTGDAIRIKEEIDWDVEAGAISRRAYEQQGPAILFDKIKDYPEGYRLFNGSLGTFRRVAISMGLDPDTPVKEIYAEYERREQEPIGPRIVRSGPCKENILLGNQVDLYRLPAPMIHEGDGGRYIGTWDLVVFKDPDSDWFNWGMYRFMIHNHRYMVGFPRYHSHLGMVLTASSCPRTSPCP
jgi:4-hydroxy-3-polyprenylbenzoate decarboxylase